MPWHARPIIDRIIQWSIVDPDTGCWVWQGAIDKDGYAKIQVGSRSNGTRTHTVASIESYVAFKGPYDRMLDIDHICRNRACVNPDHLEPVTKSENKLRSYRAKFGLPVIPRTV